MKTYITKQIGDISNGLKVQTILRHEHGMPVYGCFCTECGTSGVPVRHDKWEAAKCVSSMHGAGKFKPVTLREIREAEAAEEQRQRDIEEAKVRKAENDLTTTHRQIFEHSKSEVTSGRPDPEFRMPEQIKVRRMTVAQALKFVEAESKLFVQETPDYFPCDKNLKALQDYLWNQGCQIPDAEAYGQAFKRCRFLGLLEEKPEPEAQPQPLQVEPESVEPQTQGDDSLEGYDPLNGLKKIYTPREVDLMTSEEYRAAFHVRPRISKRLG